MIAIPQRRSVFVKSYISIGMIISRRSCTVSRNEIPTALARKWAQSRHKRRLQHFYHHDLVIGSRAGSGVHVTRPSGQKARAAPTPSSGAQSAARPDGRGIARPRAPSVSSPKSPHGHWRYPRQVRTVLRSVGDVFTCTITMCVSRVVRTKTTEQCDSNYRCRRMTITTRSKSENNRSTCHWGATRPKF